MTLTTEVEIDPLDMWKNNSREESEDFIINLDKAVADFTFELLKRLINSLNRDITREELSEFLNKCLEQAYEKEEENPI